ncbi:hypothetical protein H0H81_001025 [Sphagnurus paluster]|uniref:Glutathione S-transferase n=1 Tax=Sphagnurus paluster TaxID=117069 RepID=A0A9P7FW37_9AGAR|nr:hypothetical protein H0H81_001025 [Sphagnurus paluster]
MISTPALRRLGPIVRSFRLQSTAASVPGAPDFNPSQNVHPGDTQAPLLLYTAGTPNGRKVAVLLEELKVARGLQYDVHKITLSKNEQKEPWFLALNPNGRIPALVDRNRGGFAVFESGAILVYLAQHYDVGRMFAFDPAREPEAYSEMLQWVFWAVSAHARYTDETERLYGVLEMRLADRDHLVGPGRGKYTIADINAHPWVAGHKWAGVESLDRWPNMKRWVEGIAERPAVQAGFAV